MMPRSIATPRTRAVTLLVIERRSCVVVALKSMIPGPLVRGNQGENTYCLTGERSPGFERCLTTGVPVASLISARATAPLSILNQCLLKLALWSCGRRGSVVQAQRQIHRALCTAITGKVARPIAEQVQLTVLMRKAKIRGGSEYHLVRGFSAPFLQAPLQCSQLSVRV